MSGEFFPFFKVCENFYHAKLSVGCSSEGQPLELTFCSHLKSLSETLELTFAKSLNIKKAQKGR